MAITAVTRRQDGRDGDRTRRSPSCPPHHLERRGHSGSVLYLVSYTGSGRNQLLCMQSNAELWTIFLFFVCLRYFSGPRCFRSGSTDHQVEDTVWRGLLSGHHLCHPVSLDPDGGRSHSLPGFIFSHQILWGTYQKASQFEKIG